MENVNKQLLDAAKALVSALNDAMPHMATGHDGVGPDCTKQFQALINGSHAVATAEQAQQVELNKLSSEWTPCVKLPVTVHVREQRQGETHVSTREGITPILPNDLIMRGVMGEEYPIGRELFEKTYRIGEATSQPEVVTRVAAEREACAITAWNYYMDECRRKNIHPADFSGWCAASAIRARSTM